MSCPRARSNTTRTGLGIHASIRSTRRESGCTVLAMLEVFPRAEQATRSSAVDLEPDARLAVLGHAPAVGDLLHEVQAPPRVLVHRRERLAGLEPRSLIRHLDTDRA